jgi:hypothetical protein
VEQLVIDGRQIAVSDLPEGPKPFALVAFRQIEAEDHVVAIRMVFRRHVLQIGELQLHELQRQEAEKPGRQSHLGRFPGEPRPLPLRIRHRPGLDDWCEEKKNKKWGQTRFNRLSTSPRLLFGDNWGRKIICQTNNREKRK